MDTPDDLKHLLGKTHDEAKEDAAAAGYEFRVAAQEGRLLLVTADFRPNRVNVRLSADGKVTAANRG